jgi:predicted dehydrogenase
LIQQSEEATLSGIVDPAAPAADVARRAGVRLYATLGELLAARRPDGVILATPNRLHADQALECIAAGVPVLVEKPVADSVEEGEWLCAAAERAGAKVLVGHHRVHSPLLAAACAVIERGTLGRLVAVQGSALFYKPEAYFDEAPWRRQTGGGPILINLIHEIGNLRAMCGEIVAVQALSSNAVRGFPVEDTVAVNLSFASGALGTFLLSDTAASPRSWEQTSQENPSYATYPDEDCYVVVGTDGSLAVPSMRLRTYARKEDRSWWKPFQTEVVPVRREDPLARQLAHFCAVIRGEASPRVTARDGLANLRVTEAIAAAARSGTTVRLDYR